MLLPFSPIIGTPIIRNKSKHKDQQVNQQPTSHFSLPVLDALVNEIRWEEFIDVDLKYFDNQRIREKCIDVGEKEIYDLFYDYDSSFVHGLWGAVRECSMLLCNSPDHQFHTVPDIYNNQNLPDVKTDGYNIMILLYTFFCSFSIH